MSSQAPIVIIGAGQTGGRLALALREEGFTGPIRLIGEEPYLPCERPPLSKQVLLGESTPEQTYITTEEQLATLGIDWQPSIRVTQIEPANQCIHLSNGQVLAYQSLILATGGTPRPLVMPGAEVADIYYLRSIDDAIRLRAQLQAGHTVGVIGGGFIGLEIASSAKQLGCNVFVIEAADRLASRVLPTEISTRLLALHQHQGVNIHLGTGIERLSRQEQQTQIHLKSGDILNCDVLVAGIGIAPNQSLAESAGLSVGNGILVDHCLQTSSPNIYAIGDVAALPVGMTHQRTETWRNAEHQARYLAKHLTGDNSPFVDTLWFWSDQFDEELQVIGETGPDLLPVIRQQSDEATLVIYQDENDRIRGAAGIGKEGSIAKDIKLLERLITTQKAIHPATLADPTVSLKSLLKGN